MVVIGNSGKIEFVNGQVIKWFGYTKEELLGKPMEFLMPEHQIGIHLQKRDEYMADPLKHPMGCTEKDFKGRRKDGSEFIASVTLSPSKIAEEKIVTAVIRDMTERHKWESEMQFLATTARMLAESFEDTDVLKKMAYLAVSEIADGCVVRLLGDDDKLYVAAVIHRDQNKQQSLESLVMSLEARGIRLSNIDEALKTKVVQIRENLNEILKAEISLESREAQELEKLGPFNSAAIPLLVHGKILGVLHVLSEKSQRSFKETDIKFLEAIGTQVAISIENARLYKRAQLAIKQREEILAIVSHDLKNPLTSIKLNSQILAKIERDESKITVFADKIGRSTDQMQRMITDLMDFSKIQTGKLAIEKKWEKPNVVIEEVFEMMKDQAEEKGLKIFWEVDPKLPAIQCDKQRIGQALLNLIANAIKFTEKDGRIQISAVNSPDGIRFSVADSGPGIPKEDLLKVFDRYWQAQRTQTLGAGLGLSITKGIIDAHGGKIWVESELGFGSTFYFVLPFQV